jgi:hypothetical protein
MDFLRQGTESTVILGPFVDDTDPKVLETALSITQADIRLSKNGADFAQSNNDSGAIHKENGYYAVPLDIVDSGTLGILDIQINKSGALSVWKSFMVIAQHFYDVMMGVDILHVDTTQIKGVDAIEQLDFATPTDVENAQADIIDAIPTASEIDTELTSKHGSGPWTSGATGSGSVYVNHTTEDDSGQTMEYILQSGEGIIGASVNAFVKSEYDSGLRVSNGYTSIIAHGYWAESLKLFPDVQYVIEFYRYDMNIKTTTVTPTA